MPDNYSQWEAHEAKKEAWLKRRPVCDCCGNPIQEDFCYQLHGEIICTHCLNEYFREEIEEE